MIPYLSHRLVHFDLPWSLMVFQQRNGRVDRYGQSETPIITYLINRSDNPRVRGDQRILEILKEKDEQAYKNIGDPATFMKVHDPEAEEALTMEAMAEGTDAAAFDAQYQPDDSNEGDDLLAMFLNPEAAGSPSQPEQGEGDSPTVERYSKAHPVIWEWFAIRCRPSQAQGEVVEVLDAESWLPRLGLDGKLPNRARPIDLEPLKALRRPVIEAAEQQMAERQAEFSAATRPELARQLDELNALQERQIHQLEQQLAGSRQAEHFKASRREQRLGRIEAVFDDYRTWVEDTLTIEPVPFIQIIAVMTRDVD